MTVWQFLKKKMAGYLDHTALVYGNERLTYPTLIDLVENDHSRKSPAVFNICGQENKIEQVVKILRCFHENRICVPVNLEYGEGYTNGIKSVLEENIATAIPENLACIMFTSGSTDKPKGVMLSHENIVSNIKAIAGYFKIDSSDSILIARPLMHAAVLTGELLVSLYKGLTVHLYSEAFQPQRILSYIKENNITVFCGTPTLLSLLCRYIKDKLPLKSVAVSGECLSESIAKKIAESLPDTDIYSVYGLTEASPRVTYLPPELFKLKPGSIGIPIDGVELKLENDKLFVRSPGVMQGYLGNGTLTNSKIQNGWLDTGDIAYMDNDGCYYMKGRADNMIIRSGMNIYPEEIENRVKENSAIKEALCYTDYNKISGQIICLDVVTHLKLQEIHKFVRETLPPFMQPNQIQIVEELDRSENGKIKRRK